MELLAVGKMTDSDSAAAKLQARQRGNNARRLRESERSAATKIQARFRGRAVREGFLARHGFVHLERRITGLFSMFNGFGSPIRGSVVSLEMHRLSPADANCFERTRDRLLAAMAAAEFQLAIAAAVLGIGLVCALLGVIVLFFPLNFGVALGGLERTTVDACNESLYNASWIVTAGTTTFPPRVDHPSVPTLTKWTTTGTGGKYGRTSWHCKINAAMHGIKACHRMASHTIA